MKGSRNQTPNTLDNFNKEHYFFSLKPIQKTVYVQKQVVIDLSPIYNNKKCRFENIYPQYNSDGKEFLPAFILECDKKQYQINEKIYKENHQEKKFCFQHEKSELMIPKPNSKNQYCNICKSTYSDYLEHVEQLSHKKKISKNIYSKYIQKFCSEFQKTKTKISKSNSWNFEKQNQINKNSIYIEEWNSPRKRKNIQSTGSETNIINDDKLQLIGNISTDMQFDYEISQNNFLLQLQ